MTDTEINNEIVFLYYILKYRDNSSNPNLDSKEKINKVWSELGKVKTKEDLFSTSLYDSERKKDEDTIKKLSEKNKANVAPKCPRCKSERFYVEEQRRSGDEGKNFEIHCPTCGYIQFL
jgi:DNA-directed RNA polymerase subunit M/transcription elongation factor TFIIS